MKRLRIDVFFAGLLAVFLSACSSQHALKPDQALVEIESSETFSNRVKNPRFVSVNRKSLRSSKTHLYLPPGRHEVVMRYQFPGTDDMNTKLDIKVSANNRYAVRFDVYPQQQEKRSFDGWVSPSFERLMIVALPIEAAYRLGAQGAHTARQFSTKVDWAHIDVVSSDPEEGMVRVRVP